jgi:prepilin-type N-terminal cleavage/methylation domain-containing protein
MRRPALRHPVRLRSAHGFTLIEALFALAMLAVLLPVVMEGISVAISLSSQARRQAEAASLARSKLDELVATAQWNGGASLSGNFEPDHPGYQWSASTSDWQSGSMTELDVQVTWTARQHPQSVTVSTLVTIPADTTTTTQ